MSRFRQGRRDKEVDAVDRSILFMKNNINKRLSISEMAKEAGA